MKTLGIPDYESDPALQHTFRTLVTTLITSREDLDILPIPRRELNKIFKYPYIDITLVNTSEDKLLKYFRKSKYKSLEALQKKTLGYIGIKKTGICAVTL
ncbi:hypothetical protein NQ318_020557 [Aromia moschata]|uniref:Uncharacterized protein n=1 Tax=Aromia moschata TaxID=1265417 RepID=A0AAV8Z1W8_9CUCU|nr:hypothetical protein NQ318_020557 [Aromia moschata]